MTTVTLIVKVMIIKQELKMNNKNYKSTTTIMEIIFWNFLILYQTFFSPQVKWSVIISNKHDIYDLPQALPNDLRLKDLRK